MDENQLKGLLLDVAKRLGQQGEHARDWRDLDDAEPDDVDRLLRDLQLPYAPHVRGELAAWLSEDWGERRRDVLRAAERARILRRSPSS